MVQDDTEPNIVAEAPPAGPELAFERLKWADEVRLRERELAVKEGKPESLWKNPLLIAILTAAAAAAGNAAVSWTNADSQVKLEQLKAEQDLIIEAIKTGGDVDKASANLGFLVNAGLLTDAGRSAAITNYLAKNRNKPELLPSLPTATGDQQAAAQTVYIQFAGVITRESIVALNSDLRKVGWRVQSDSGERTPVAAGLNEVRYSQDSDAPAAEALAKAASAAGITSRPIVAKQLGIVKPGVLELWISK